MNEEQQQDKIKDLQDVLYSKNTDGIFEKKRHDLQNNSSASSKNEWQNEPAREPAPVFAKPNQIPYRKILTVSFLFFAFASIFAFYEFSGGLNTISSDKINILVSGPTTVAGGEVFPLDIEVDNGGVSALKVVDMKIEYPDGSVDSADLSSPLKRYTQVLGDISVGGNAKAETKLAMFGQENDQKIIKVTIEYRVEGSNAIFDKEKDYTVVMGTSPLDISVDGPSKINSNQEADYSVTVKSNSLSILKNLLLKVDYPFGFNLTTSNPKPYSSDGSVFNLGDLQPGGTRVVKITGILQGQQGEERVLKFSIGNPNPDDTKTVGTVFSSNTLTVSIMQSSIGINFLINQNPNGGASIRPGIKNDGNIYWKNNLPNKVNDMSVVVYFSGKALDKSSISASNGFYNSSENSIVFDKNNDASLGTVNPLDSGSLNFNFSAYDTSFHPEISFGNSEIDLTVNIYGTTGGNPRSLLYTGKKILKISSSLNLISEGLRINGPFANSGPFPPKADQESTYTITWTAKDSFNNISGAKVSSSLASNVKWSGITSPSSEDISYDDSSRQIVWNIGDMRSNVGGNLPAKQVSFQVSAIPSLSQVGSFLSLINPATMTGTDSYSGESITQIAPAVTTDLVTDSGYANGEGKVVK